eukprot:COSAG04_NODE_19045_length_426_cov_0.948012_1_plen_61_part_10
MYLQTRDRFDNVRCLNAGNDTLFLSVSTTDQSWTPAVKCNTSDVQHDAASNGASASCICPE